MAIGEERELVIPAAEGYGADGFPTWGIPPGGTLKFTLECLEGGRCVISVAKLREPKVPACSRIQ